MRVHVLFTFLLLQGWQQSRAAVVQRGSDHRVTYTSDKVSGLVWGVSFPPETAAAVEILVGWITDDENYNFRTRFEGESGPVDLELGEPDMISEDESECDGGRICAAWTEHNLKFTLYSTPDVEDNFFIEWTKISAASNTGAASISTCLKTTDHLYGAGEQMFQNWPIDPIPHPFHVPYVTDDFLSPPFQHWGGVSERYWLTSGGATIVIPKDIPLFHTYQHELDHSKKLCFESKYESPFKQPADKSMAPHKVVFGGGSNVKNAHVAAIKNHFELPSGIPDEKMMSHPIWSTWAMYKADINEDKVLEFANAITEHGFTNSQLEIDDDWETCYGSAEFNREKFPNVEEMVATLKEKGFRVTLWIHPFINEDCTEAYSYADAQGFLVKDSQGNSGRTSWWNSNKAGIIDPTNPEAVTWWTGRLKKLQEDIGIDSFKFDAGETGWLPDDYELEVEPSLQPEQYTTAYVDMVKQFGPMIEVRVGFRSQTAPVFVRMLDKSSSWSIANGLQSMIPSALLIGISGYPFVLPDMIGGNGYGPTGFPSKELYIRWAQVNAFMPALQLSIVPWYYDEETVNITRAMTQLHQKYADRIIELGKEATQNGAPINRPLWWVATEDERALTCGDEFLVGDDLLVAPVVTRRRQRDIYLPAGSWRDEVDAAHPVYEGPTTLSNYKVQLHQLPYFTRV